MKQVYWCIFKNSKPWFLFEGACLFPNVHHTTWEGDPRSLLLASFLSIRPIIGVYLTMCAAPDRVPHCNSPVSLPQGNICISDLINQYVKKRKLWDNPYAYCCWALKSSIKFLSTFSCLYCGAKWIKQGKICGHRVGAFVQYNTYCESKKYWATSLKLTLEWHCNPGHLSSSSRYRWMCGGEWRLPAALY